MASAHIKESVVDVPADGHAQRQADPHQV